MTAIAVAKIVGGLKIFAPSRHCAHPPRSVARTGARSRTRDDRKQHPMTSNSIVSEAETAAVDLGAGITNFFENIGTQLGTVAKTVSAGKTTTTTGTALPSVTTGGTNVLSQIEGAAGAIGKLVTDAKGGNIGGAVGDAVSLATTGMAILTKFGISVPGLSTFTSLLTEVEAFV